MKKIKALSACAVTGVALCAFGVAAPKPVLGTPAPKLSGLYRAFPAVPQFGAAIGEAYVFSSKGDVYKGWTGTQSPQSFNFARARAKEPAQTGKYLIVGDKITFRWSNKQSETASFSLRRDAKTGRTTMSIGPYFCYKIVAWNQALEGTFEPSTYQGGFADSPEAIRDRIAFTRSGQFTITGDDAQTVLKGRYSVQGAALTLSASNGKKSTHSLHVFEDRRRPLAAVLIDGRPFSLAK